MPYSGPSDENLPDNVKALPESQRSRWVQIWNSAYQKCMDDDGKQDTCETSAFRQANGVIGKAANSALQYTCNQTAKVRHEKVNGTQYLVAPVVAICEGVLNGELVTAEEISAHFHSWDGRPFVIGHPKAKDGTGVSANEPETLAKFQIGQLFHTEFDDGKLKGELWIDLDRVPVVDGAREVVNRLEQGKPLEVSTAYFRDREEKAGKFSGIEYGIVARNLKPDHLAALLDVEGACSWEDGCGAPRVNQDFVGEARHRRDKCMSCDKVPQIEALWAEGMGHAWFCNSCFKKWSTTGDGKGEICNTKVIEHGIAR